MGRPGSGRGGRGAAAPAGESEGPSIRDDASYRVVPTDVPTDELRATHFAYDVRDARSDVNVVFPIDTLRGLVADGVVGSLTDEAYTFMGGIYSARRVREQLAPALVQRMIDQRADAVLLVPV